MKQGKSELQETRTIDFGLGYHEELSKLFYLGDPSMKLEDAITFIVNQSLERDLFAGAYAQAYQNGNGEYRLKVVSPTDDVSAYEHHVTAYIAAGKLGQKTFSERAGGDVSADFQFLLPFGLAMARVKSIQLLHFPPLETYTYRDYLYSPTNRRWECLLVQNGFDGAKNTLLERVIDVAPIAAPGGGGREIAKYNDDFVDYALAQLRNFLRPVSEAAGGRTQPVVAYGGPVHNWLKVAFYRKTPKTAAEKFNHAAFTRLKNQPPGTLDLLELKISDAPGAPVTPVLCANHPSQYLYDTEVPLSKAEQPYQDYGAPIDIMAQDLVAAGWQARMSMHPHEDAFTTLHDMMDRWGVSPKTKKMNDADKSKVSAVKGIMKEQDAEFSFGKDTFVPEPAQARAEHFLLRRSKSSSTYSVFAFEPERKEVFTEVPISPYASYAPERRLLQVGGYLVDAVMEGTDSKTPALSYRLVEFDRSSGNPLAEKSAGTGKWPQEKFFGDYRPNFGAPFSDIELIPFGGYVLSVVPAPGRRTYQLWSFDPSGENDCLNSGAFQQGGFRDIQSDRELLSLGNYVLDRMGKHYRVWSFDPQASPPLALPVVFEGTFKHIEEEDALCVVGDWLLAWQPKNLKKPCRIFRFDPGAKEPFGDKPVKTCALPSGFTADSTLFGILPKAPVVQEKDVRPGSIEFMRKEIKHVVYYMLESRSFDNVLGWLYAKGKKEGLHFIGGGTEGFRGLDASMKNRMSDGSVAPVTKYKNGKLSNAFVLGGPAQDPWHDNSDVLMQMFHGYEGYKNRQKPKMDGFAWNQDDPAVMSSFTPEQLTVLNGLASNFAVSDDWFGSCPGGTDVNRGFSVSGSAYDRLGTWEGGKAYADWPDAPHRQSVWKVLWNHGHRDFKIYYNILWEEAVFTYELYLSGLIPEVDAAWAKAVVAAAAASRNGQQVLPNSEYIAPFAQFKEDVGKNALPRFSYIEPAWVGTQCTSYHPGSGANGLDSIVPGEAALADIYDTLRGAKEIWPHTLFVITFDKAGGLYDHVPPPYAKKPWPADKVDGFEFDLMGPRVPAVMVSPFIKPGTVLRGKGSSFDSTSFIATLLDWYGIPRGAWGLGDRVPSVPTLESVLSLGKARETSPSVKVPYDKVFPKKGRR